MNTAGTGVGFVGPVVLAAGGGAITLTGNNAGNAVSFSASSTVDGAQSLSITAGTLGPVTFAAGAVIGGTTPLTGVSVVSSGTSSLQAVTTSGAQSYTATTSTTLNGTLFVNTAGTGVGFVGPVVLAAGGGAITLTGNNAGNTVSFSGTSTVNGAQSLSITVGTLGPVNFAAGAVVGGTTPLTGMSVVSSGTSSLQAVTTTGAQSYTATTSTTLNGTLFVNTAGSGVAFVGPVVLAAGGGAITLTGNNAGNAVSFSASSTVNGAQSLSITAGTLGPVSFAAGAVIGGTTPLTGVSVVSSGTSSLQAVTTSGAQSYTATTSTTLNGTLFVNTAGTGVGFVGPVVLAAGGGAITLTGNNAGNAVSFSASSTVNGAQSLSITAGTLGPVNFAAGAVIGGTTPLTGVSVVSSGTSSLQAVTTTGAQSYTATTSTTLNGTLLVNTAGTGVAFVGPVVLAAGGGAITLTGNNAGNAVSFSASSTVNGAQSLSITAGTLGPVTFAAGAVVGGTTPLTGVSVISSGTSTSER